MSKDALKSKRERATGRVTGGAAGARRRRRQSSGPAEQRAGGAAVFIIPAADVTKLEPHPLSRIVPPMHADDFAALRDNILAERRVKDAIVLLDGKVLDGNNRTAIAA
jgi:hypothetical protein